MVRVNRLLDPTQTGSKAAELEAGLHSRIVGQDEAIREIVGVYQMFQAGLAAPGRPLGNFLFLGPTGTGKTRVVEAAAETLFGERGAMVKIDCAEFQHSHEIAKLIGSPPGYLGHRETHPLLSQEALNRNHTDKLKLTFVLFDEIEKASDALWNLLLGILDKGVLTLGDNRQVDFTRAMIFMTSNLGAREMMAFANPGPGFVFPSLETADAAGKVERTGIEAARRRFTPEFLNRIDKVIVFHPLSSEDLRRILDLELAVLRRRFLDQNPTSRFAVTVAEPAKDFLLEQGTDARYGARHLKRALDRLMLHPVSNLLASSQIRGGDWIRVDFDDQERRLMFYKQAEDVDVAEMAKISATPDQHEPDQAVAAAARAGSSKLAVVRRSPAA
jgi:ATP-dependent Clp protease ATP-binding subunit ClpB